MSAESSPVFFRSGVTMACRFLLHWIRLSDPSV